MLTIHLDTYYIHTSDVPPYHAINIAYTASTLFDRAIAGEDEWKVARGRRSSCRRRLAGLARE